MPLQGIGTKQCSDNSSCCRAAASQQLAASLSWTIPAGGSQSLLRCMPCGTTACCSCTPQGVPSHLSCGSTARQCTCSAALLPAQVKLLEQNEDRFGAKASPDTHFGHDVIPHALRDKLKVVAHHFTGYWRVSLILAGSNKAITATLAATHHLSSQCCKALPGCCSLLTAPALSLVVPHGRPHQVAMVPSAGDIQPEQ